MKEEIVKITEHGLFPNGLSPGEISTIVSARQLGKSSLANWIVTSPEIANAFNEIQKANSKKYDRAEIVKEMDPILRLMKKIGYEI